MNQIAAGRREAECAKSGACISLVTRCSMNRSTMLISVVGLLIAVPALAQESGPPVQRGAALVTEHCAMCHAVGRTDVSLERQAPPLRDIGRRVPLARLSEQMAMGAFGGHPQMPRFNFSQREVNAIMRYLETIQE